MASENKCIPGCYFLRLSVDPSTRPTFDGKKMYSMDNGDLVCTAGCWCEEQPITYNEYLLIRALGCQSFISVPKPEDLKKEGRFCCHIPCDQPAEWQIWYGDGPDDFTESCTEHIPALLTDAPEHRIYPIKELKNR